MAASPGSVTPRANRPAATWDMDPGFLRWLALVNHKIVGIRYLLFAFAFFALGGVDSLVLRAQLTWPLGEVMGPHDFNQLLTMHGSAMMFLFAMPVLTGFAVYLVPLMIGAREVPFPRLNAFGFWLFAAGGLLLYASTLPDPVNFILPGTFLPDFVPAITYTAYPPLSTARYSPAINTDYWVLAVAMVESAGLIASINLVVTILKARASGMTLGRMPVFVWTILLTCLATIVVFPAGLVALLLLALERQLRFPFFDPLYGGDPVLWQHLYWLFGHPRMFILLLPAFGIISTVLPVFVRRPLVGYGLVVLGCLGAAVTGVALWFRHLMTIGLAQPVLALVTVVSVVAVLPVGLPLFAWLATAATARRVNWGVPLLWVLAGVATFAFGGITGVMLTAAPFNWQAHDTYFVVGYLHYVLVGGVVFPAFGGLTYWLPKMTGRLQSVWLGRVAFALTFTGFNLTMFPMYLMGLLGMPRRVYTYQPDLGLDGYNLIASIGAAVMVLGVATFALDAVRSVWSGTPAGADPWRAATLEWSVTSPPPPENFDVRPVVHGRDPLWGSESVVVVAKSAPAPVRATSASSLAAVRQRDEYSLAGPSFAPMLLAGAVVATALGVILRLEPVALVGLVAAVIVVLWWSWPDEAERARSRVERARASKRPAPPVEIRTTVWWATTMTIVALALALAYLLFAYAYYWTRGQTGPIGADVSGVTDLPLAAGAMLLSLGAARAAALFAGRGWHAGVMAGLSLVLGCGIVALASEASLLRWPMLSPELSVGDAIFAATVGYHATLVVVGLVAVASRLAQIALGNRADRRGQSVAAVSLYWSFVAISWLGLFGAWSAARAAV